MPREKFPYAEVQVERARQLPYARRRVFLRKLARAVKKLIEEYNIEDPQVLGLHTLSEDEVYRWALERCHGLSLAECVNRIEREIARHGRRQIIRENVRAIKDMIEQMELEAKRLHEIAERFRIPVDIDRQLAAELENIYKHPELNHDAVKSLVSKYLLELGYDEEEANRIAEESARVIDKLVAEKNRPIAVADWMNVLRSVTHRGRMEYERRRQRARSIVEQFIRDALGETVILSVRELELVGFLPSKAKRAKDAREAERLLREQYRGRPAVVGSPAIVVYFDDSTFCEVAHIRKGRIDTWILRRCTKPVVVYKRKGGVVYYQVVGGGKHGWG